MVLGLTEIRGLSPLADMSEILTIGVAKSYSTQGPSLVAEICNSLPNLPPTNTVDGQAFLRLQFNNSP